MSTRTQTVSYRPEIDGLRALAVIAVILFHAKIALSGGYVGVDIFFVISGYLITSLIVKDLQKGTFTFTAFWERRIRRIVPAMSVVVIVGTRSRLVSALARRLCLSGNVRHGLGRRCGKHIFLAKYQRLFRQRGGNASAPYLVSGC